MVRIEGICFVQTLRAVYDDTAFRCSFCRKRWRLWLQRIVPGDGTQSIPTWQAVQAPSRTGCGGVRWGETPAAQTSWHSPSRICGR